MRHGSRIRPGLSVRFLHGRPHEGRGQEGSRPETRRLSSLRCPGRGRARVAALPALLVDVLRQPAGGAHEIRRRQLCYLERLLTVDALKGHEAGVRTTRDGSRRAAWKVFQSGVFTFTQPRLRRPGR